MGVDDSHDRAVTTMPAVQRQGGRSGLRGQQRVDHDDAVVAFDEGHHRQVEATDLVEALDDLEQSVLGHQLPLTPQARVRRGRCITGQEVERRGVPDDLTRSIADRRVLECRDEAPLGISEVIGIRPRQGLQQRRVRRPDRLGRFVLIHHSAPVRWMGPPLRQPAQRCQGALFFGRTKATTTCLSPNRVNVQRGGPPRPTSPRLHPTERTHMPRAVRSCRDSCVSGQPGVSVRRRMISTFRQGFR